METIPETKVSGILSVQSLRGEFHMTCEEGTAIRAAMPC
jgi:hypothetical protein